MVKKLFAVGIILLFVCVSIPSTGKVMEQSSTVSSDGNTLYVGGSGEGNYTKIQDAINDASFGDTVFVYNGTYVENLVVYASINLIGENRNTTVIDGNGIGYTIFLYYTCSRITINGFTIQNSGSEGYYDSGIFIHEAHGVIITDNIVKSNMHGIYLDCTIDCQIRKNIIIENEVGILDLGQSTPHYCFNTTIVGNYISKNDCGIINALYSIGMISNNTITDNGIGIKHDMGSNDIVCMRNNISNNNIGLYSTYGLAVVQNNFINNTQHVKLRGFHSFLLNIYNSTLKRNYWDKPRKLPYPIPVRIGFHGLIPWFPQFDWHPARKPYDIEV